MSDMRHRLHRIFNPIARTVTAPYRAAKFMVDVQTANVGWDYEIKPPKLSPDRKRELLEASALETPRSALRAVTGVLAPYWTKSGWKEIATASFLLGATLGLSKLTVDQQVDFQYLNRELGDLIQTMFSAVSDIRPAMVDNLLPGYPDLQQALASNPILNQMMHAYPDTTAFMDPRKHPDIYQFISANPHWVDFLRQAPTMPDILMKFPDVAEQAKQNPEILNQLNQVQTKIGSQLYESNSGSLTRFLQLCFTDFFSNWGNALGKTFNSVASGAGVSEDARQAIGNAWQSKDFGNIVAKFLVLALSHYKASQTLVLRWRAWTTGYFANKWLTDDAYSQLKNKFNNIDNPDQRIQDDPYRFTTGAVSVLTGLVSTGFRFAAMAGVLWGLSNWNLAYFGGPDVVLPGTMFWIGFSYAAALTGLTWAAGRKLPEISRNQQMREANFRSALKKVQDNTDEVSLNGSEDLEREIIKNQYVPVVNNQVREINTNIKMTLVDSTFGNLSIPVPLFAGAFSVATGTMSMGTLSLLHSSFGAVTSSLSFIVNRWDQLSAMKAVADRLSSFDKSVDLVHYEAEEKRQAARKMTASAPAL